MDPILTKDLTMHKTFAKLSTTRRDIWPSREAAREKFKSSRLFQTWDPRVLEKFIEYGLRDLPTEQYPELPEGSDPNNPPVTLSTTIPQEVYFYIRAYYRDKRLLQDENYLQDIHPDDYDTDASLYRPESSELYRRLPEIKPSVLYIFADKSEASPPEYRLDKMTRTGTGVGGSGGAAVGRVQEAVLDCGHLIGMERPMECAEASAAFIDGELERWLIREEERDAVWEGLSRRERVDINDAWRRNVVGFDAKSVTGRTDKKG